MKYVQVCKALYDYSAAAPDEIDIHEDDIVYILEKEDENWWRAELKQASGEPGATGLVPATYLEECMPIGSVRAEYAYTGQHEEELTFDEGDEMFVLERDGPDWLLVKMTDGRIGLVPANYVSDTDGTGTHEQVEDTSIPAQQEPAEVPASTAVPVPVPLPVPVPVPVPAAVPGYQPMSEPVRQIETQRTGGLNPIDLNDDAQTWAVHEYDVNKKKKKKSKGNLLVGSGMICYGSETDKTSPVQQYPILDVQKYLSDGKHLHIEITGKKNAVLDLHASSKSEVSAIIAKIKDSIQIASSATTQAPPSPVQQMPPSYAPRPQQAPAQVHDEAPEMPKRPTQTTAPAHEPRWGIVLYAFEAEGEGEISVVENEQVLVLDGEREDGWWMVEKTNGVSGIIPSTYAQYQDADDANQVAVDYEAEERQRREQERIQAEEEERHRQEQERQLREQQEARQREEARQQEEARQREEARKQAEARQREEEERERRRKLQEAAQRSGAARQRQVQEDERQKTSENQKSHLQRAQTTSDKSRQRDSHSSGVSRSQSTSSRSQELTRPDMTRVRVWTDRTGTFQVEAQFLAVFDGSLRLHKVNGVKINVPLEKMSAADIKWIERHTGRTLTKEDEPATEPQGQKTPTMPPRPIAESMAPKPAPSTQSTSSKKTKVANPNWDWFDWFMMIGIPMDAALVYSSAFKAENLDDSDITSLTHKQMKTLGLKERHVQRIERYVDTEKVEPPSDGEEASEVETPIFKSRTDKDEELARKLFRELNGVDPPLESGKQSTSRPKPNVSAPVGVHPDLVEFIGTQFTAGSDQSSTNAKNQPTGDLLGFDDDAWTPRGVVKQDTAQTTATKSIQEPLMPQKTAASSPPAALEGSQAPIHQIAQILSTSQTIPSQTTGHVQPAASPAHAFQNQQLQQQPASTQPQQPSVSTVKNGTIDPSLGKWQQSSATTGSATMQVAEATGSSTNGTAQTTQTMVTSALTGQQTGAVLGLPQQQLQQQLQQQQQLQLQLQLQQQRLNLQQQQLQMQLMQQQPTNLGWRTRHLEAQVTGWQQESAQKALTAQPSWPNPAIGSTPQPLQPMMPSSIGMQHTSFTGYQSMQQTSTPTGFGLVGVAAQPTGARSWQAATPENPFAIESPGPLSPQRTGVQFSTPNANMFTQSPMQAQPTGYLQPQMTGIQPQPTNAMFTSMGPGLTQPSVFTPAGSMAYGQSGFPQSQYRG